MNLVSFRCYVTGQPTQMAVCDAHIWSDDTLHFTSEVDDDLECEMCNISESQPCGAQSVSGDSSQVR